MRYAFLLKTLPDPDLLGMPITERCRILGVSPSGYYEWRNRQLGCPRQKTYQAERSKINDETIVMTIRRIRKDLGYTPGYRQFHALLRRCGIHVGLKRLQRTLREHGYIGYRHHRRPYKTTDSNHRLTVYPNLLNRNFVPGELNRAWVSYNTYLPTPVGPSFLATFMDLGSRRILGWAIDTSMSTQLVLRAFNMAVRIRKAERISLDGTIVLSDRGTQYCSKLFQSRLNELNMRSSMSEVGQCWDNAPSEAIWSSLKRETLIGRRMFSSHEAAAREVTHWINIYNQLRPHSAIGMQIPLEYDRSLKLLRMSA